MAYASIDATALAGRRVMHRCPIRQQWRRQPRGAPRLSTPPALCMLCMLRWQVSAWMRGSSTCAPTRTSRMRRRARTCLWYGTPLGGHGGGDPRFGDELPGYGSCARAGGLGRDCGRAGNCGGRARLAWSCAVSKAFRRRWACTPPNVRERSSRERRLGWVDVSDRGLLVISPESHPHTFVHFTVSGTIL